MTASEYLRQGRLIGLEIVQKKKALSNINNETLRSAYIDDIRKREKALAELLKKIGQIPDAYHRIILTDYYILGMTIEQIAEELNYSDSQIKRHKKKAVKAFAEFYDFVKYDTEVT